MKILLLGNQGQLGWELERTLATAGILIAVDYPDIDLVHPESIRPLIRSTKPEIIINATAYTAVDRAESEAEIAYAINGITPGVLAEAALEYGALLIHFSTDYVFDGKKGSAYIESDIPNPLGVYGASKLAGEQAIQQVGGQYLILRTSWVYSLRRPSFVTKVLEWSRQQPVLRVVNDQVASPTWARMLAEWTAQLLAKSSPDVREWLKARLGLYHLAGDGSASRYDWAQAILALDPHPSEQVTHQLEPALTAEFPTPAERPLFSALDCNRAYTAFGLRLPDWRAALKLAMDSIQALNQVNA